jgi:hypothetical protein
MPSVCSVTISGPLISGMITSESTRSIAPACARAAPAPPSAAGLQHGVAVAAQHAVHDGADGAVVFHEQHGFGLPGRHLRGAGLAAGGDGLAVAGKWIVNVVPWSGALSTAMWPPSCLTTP